MTYLYFVLLENGETIASCFLQDTWGLNPWSTADEGNTVIPLAAAAESHGIQYVACLIFIIRAQVLQVQAPIANRYITLPKIAKQFLVIKVYKHISSNIFSRSTSAPASISLLVRPQYNSSIHSTTKYSVIQKHRESKPFPV